MNQFKYILITRSKLLIAFVLGCAVAIWMIACAPKKEVDEKQDVSTKTDALKEKPQVKIVHDTIYKCPPIKKPLPAITVYKIGDLACAWNKFSGVVNAIKWVDGNVLMYQLVYMIDNADGTHGWQTEE